MRVQVLKAIKSQPRRAGDAGGSGGGFKTVAKVFFVLGGWAVAVGLALLFSALWIHQHKLLGDLDALKLSQGGASEAVPLREEKTKLIQQLADAQKSADAFRQEIMALKQTSALASLEVTSLRSQNKPWMDCIALVVWDNAKQEGLLKLSKMPPATSGHDYRLWVVDSTKPAPVSAGVVKVNEQGSAFVAFKPASQITSATKFALSLEKLGGVEKNEGLFVLTSP